ncbi:Bacteriophage P22, Gp10, DNA-stabilising [uncultured Caudovirales phage]|uniref:Bacteriophage P22, Gp10, DNA-stabilising n=1 Tax=uncultured Caudovirales phage TaxID=2100421 RepID=A0A6J5KG14_9CAUD|nr:Bacteriophage P22, Gp10, DNA-stabilising [uncultured Caudovirales phage]
MGAAILPESTRPPLLPLFDSRNDTGKLDSKLVNGFLEKGQDGNIWANKRPGLTTTQNIAVAGNGTGCYFWARMGALYSVVGGNLYKEAILVGAVPALGGFVTFGETLGTPAYLFIKGATGAYTVTSAGVFAQVVDADYPANTVQGSAYLDGTTYVMDTAGRIWGSALNDPTSWDALNVIVPQIEPDLPIAIAKQLIYVVAFMASTTEIFYDAANPVGAPLLPVQNAKMSVGALQSDMIQSIDDVLYFQGINKTSTPAIYKIEGVKLKKISTAAIDKLLGFYVGIRSWQARRGGHSYYGFKAQAVGSLVYDISMDEWYIWTEAGDYLDIVASTSNTSGQSYLQSSATGSLFRSFNPDVYTDYSTYTNTVGALKTDIITPNFDGGTRVKKYLAKLRLVADQNSGGSLKVCWSDDDYKTWSPWQVVNLQEDSPQLTQLGSFKKRAFWFQHESSTAFRMASAEMELLAGDS